MKNSRIQLGDRVPVDLAAALSSLAETLDIPRQRLAEDALAHYMGKSDPLLQARRKMVMDAFKTGKVDRPFNPGLVSLNIGAAAV